MTTPEVAKDLFREVQAIFPQIVGAPNDDDVKRITEAFINALQSIDVPGGSGRRECRGAQGPCGGERGRGGVDGSRGCGRLKINDNNFTVA